jgi:hypothetical protein
MKKLSLLSLVFYILFGCSKTDEVSPVTEEDYINKNAQGLLEETSQVDLILDGNKVGDLSIALQRDSLFIDYDLNPDIIVRDLKFHISTSKETLPNAEGRLSSESFRFTDSDLSMPIAKITGSASYKGPIFFTFFCKVSHISNISESDIVQAKVISTHNIEDPSYFKINITSQQGTEEFQSYCLQGDQSMDTSFVHDVKRLSSLSKDASLLSSTIDLPENLDLVNWIVNQDPSRWMRPDGNPSNGADRQMAIWKLIEKTGNPTGVNIAGKFDVSTVNKIVSDAKLNGNQFKPSCGDKVLYILHKGPIGSKNQNGTYNTGEYADPNYQVNGTVHSIECHGELIVWAFGKKFMDGDIGTYFVMLKQ